MAYKDPEVMRAKCLEYYYSHRGERAEYRTANRAKINETSKAWARRNKLKVLTHYSNGSPQCMVCEEKRLACLSIDHIDGGGNTHRRSLGWGTIYRWLIRNGYPKGFQVLCMNCQFLKQYGSQK